MQKQETDILTQHFRSIIPFLLKLIIWVGDETKYFSKATHITTSLQLGSTRGEDGIGAYKRRHFIYFLQKGHTSDTCYHFPIVPLAKDQGFNIKAGVWTLKTDHNNNLTEIMLSCAFNGTKKLMLN